LCSDFISRLSELGIFFEKNNCYVVVLDENTKVRISLDNYTYPFTIIEFDTTKSTPVKGAMT